MFMNLIVLYNSNHHKIAFTQLVQNEVDYNYKKDAILKASKQSDLGNYFLRELPTFKPGIQGLRDYDSYYIDFTFYSSFTEFQFAVRRLVELKDTDVKAYLLNQFNLTENQTNQLFQMLLPQLNLRILLTQEPIPKMNLLNSRTNLLNKILRQSDGYEKFQLINKFPTSQSKIPLQTV